MSYNLLPRFVPNSFPFLALKFKKFSRPCTLWFWPWFRLLYDRTNCILIFQIFHDATSKDL